jgi:hypothetical protein
MDGSDRLTVTIEPERRIIVRSGKQTLLDRPWPAKVSRQGVQVEFGLCDQQVLLAIDQQTLVQTPYTRSAEGGETAHPLSIGVAGLAAEVAHLRVWRDIYYLDPQGLPRPWRASAPLTKGQVALLGDNQSVSTDTRHWASDAVFRDVLGCVYRSFWATYE